MFIIAEVHPFLDGNGRISRIMMNAELLKANEYPIIIPTVYRNNYLSALKALSHYCISDPLIRTMDFAQKFVASIDWSDLKNATAQLGRTNAFYDPHRADLEGVRLHIEKSHSICRVPSPGLLQDQAAKNAARHFHGTALKHQ